MVEAVMMHEAGRANMLQHLGRLVDEEQGRPLWVALDMSMHDDEVGSVPIGDEPLLAADSPAPIAPVGAGLDHAGIGSRLRLGDCKTATPVAAIGGQKITPLLIGR